MIEEMDDRNRQENEILLLSNIYNYEEFSYIKEDIMQCYFNIFPKISSSTLRLKNIDKTDKEIESHALTKYVIEYLPPIRMYLQLPNNYPTKKPPNFYIITSWLSPWQISFLCQKLDEMWLDNEGQEILFLWFEFLRNDILQYLEIKDTLDVSFLCMVYDNLENYYKLNLVLKNDIRAIYNPLFFNPLQLLIYYDKYQCNINFEKNYHQCIICFEEYSGRDCIKLQNCKHIYCKGCIQEYVSIKISENCVNDIICPSINCNSSIAIYQVKKLCPNLYPKYENSLLKVALSTMKDIIVCPRIVCQYPFIKHTNGPLGICDNCDYVFCCHCYKAYHGVIPCTMTTCDTKKLVQEYMNGNKYQRKLLEEKYGRKEVRKVIEKHMTNEYLKKNAKPCPNCQTMITKISGCNKMICIYCKASFCWLCGTQITTGNPYEHFLSNDNACYKRLFEEILV
ncbi:E3 ubiquitin-protein ligase RNF14-like isoform X2 [Calliopsis andreniformis]|uniref:E3 ubiquitin-protein ligase RNF14-like isoform X2 n=1 Tax=Calliopsis andreniformis TaxID=337506 RepID=UPI003FCCC618